MQLQPRRQPGRNDRKAALYAVEILQLRAQGYTYESIREALADVGVELSTSALRREVCRHELRSGKTGFATGAVSPMAADAERSSTLPPPRLPSSGDISGHQIAESFFDAHPSNPLLRAKEPA